MVSRGVVGRLSGFPKNLLPECPGHAEGDARFKRLQEGRDLVNPMQPLGTKQQADRARNLQTGPERVSATFSFVDQECIRASFERESNRLRLAATERRREGPNKPFVRGRPNDDPMSRPDVEWREP